MRLIDGSAGFEFKKHIPINQHVSAKIPDLLTSKPDRYRDLPLYIHSCSS